jgi:hypothetical protein
LASPNPLGACPDPGSQAHVAGKLLGVGKAEHVPEFKNEHDGDEQADTRKRTQSAHARIVTPTRRELDVELTDLCVEHAKQRAGVFADSARDLGQRQALELPVSAGGEPTLPGRRLEIATGEHGNQTIADLATDPRELGAVANELARLAKGGRRIRQRIAAERECETVRMDAIILESRARHRLVYFGCERTA